MSIGKTNWVRQCAYFYCVLWIGFTFDSGFNYLLSSLLRDANLLASDSQATRHYWQHVPIDDWNALWSC
jgi:hypothetical protein